MCTPGPSPRVRGRRFMSEHPALMQRAIPAGAGPTGAGRRSHRAQAGHPRGCGADLVADVPGEAADGPSPRVRGRLCGCGRPPRHRGAIPAGAGPTGGAAPGWGCPAGHPRGCGADVLGHLLVRRQLGPSPRVRGRREEAEGALRPARAIPAGAGPTAPFPKTAWSKGGHPRGCGADDRDGRHVSSDGGPSPRVRGRRHPRVQQGHRAGAIPAGAGSTIARVVEVVDERGHPRGCGVDIEGLKCRSTCSGPSPRVRGRLRPLCPSGRCCSGHPRGCGVDTS